LVQEKLENRKEEAARIQHNIKIRERQKEQRDNIVALKILPSTIPIPSTNMYQPPVKESHAVVVSWKTWIENNKEVDKMRAVIKKQLIS
jgi:hypothetical protein